MTDIIQMEHVYWRREKKEILQDMNWSVTKGEHWTVLGLNGSGKTTLLQMVNGYIWPTTGKVSVLQRPFGKTDIRELRKSIGWVSSSLQERINGRHLAQDIVISGKFASIGLYEEPTAADREKSLSLMDQLNCGHLIDRTYDTCSSGEKQKILIARGLMAEPELLILDEPSSGLDFIAREELMATINRIAFQENAPTIILVTHHIEEILPAFSHTLMLKEGRVFDQGRREQTLTSENMSAFFEKQINVTWENNRPWMSLIKD